MSYCDTALSNLGKAGCPLQIKVPKRLGFTLTKNSTGAYNEIALTDAVQLSKWQELMNKFNFASDVTEKVVFTPVFSEFTNEQSEPEAFDVDGVYEVTKDGNITFSFKLTKVNAYLIKQLKSLVGKNVSGYILDVANQVSGRKVGANLRPFEFVFVNPQNLNIPVSGTPSQEMVTMRLKYPEHMNDLWSVIIADADYSSDDDFYSLENVSTVISAPAVTGCVATLTLDSTSGPAVGLESGTTDYTKWNFYDAVAPTVAIPLSAAADITETTDGVYTINKSALLTTAHTYSLKVTIDGYDVEVGTVVVP